LDCCAGLMSLLGRICMWPAQLCGSFVIAELVEHAKRHVADGLSTSFQAQVAHFRIPPDSRHNRRVAPLGELSV
jgi:hypothetical protein